MIVFKIVQLPNEKDRVEALGGVTPNKSLFLGSELESETMNNQYMARHHSRKCIKQQCFDLASQSPADRFSVHQNLIDDLIKNPTHSIVVENIYSFYKNLAKIAPEPPLNNVFNGLNKREKSMCELLIGIHFKNSTIVFNHLINYLVEPVSITQIEQLSHWKIELEESQLGIVFNKLLSMSENHQLTPLIWNLLMCNKVRVSITIAMEFLSHLESHSGEKGDECDENKHSQINFIKAIAEQLSTNDLFKIKHRFFSDKSSSDLFLSNFLNQFEDSQQDQLLRAIAIKDAFKILIKTNSKKIDFILNGIANAKQKRELILFLSNQFYQEEFQRFLKPSQLGELAIKVMRKVYIVFVDQLEEHDYFFEKLKIESYPLISPENRDKLYNLLTMDREQRLSEFSSMSFVTKQLYLEHAVRNYDHLKQFENCFNLFRNQVKRSSIANNMSLSVTEQDNINKLEQLIQKKHEILSKSTFKFPILK